MTDNEVTKKKNQRKSPPRKEKAGDDKNEPALASDSVQLRESAIKSGDQFFWATDGDAYVSVSVDDHTETHRLWGKHYQRILGNRFFSEFKRPARQTLIQETLYFIECQISPSMSPREVHTRIAEHEGQIYLDLHAPNYSIVRIGKTGWWIENKAPISFIRSGTAAPQAIPIVVDPREGVRELRQFLNVGTDDDFHLVLAWLLSTLNPRGPFPVLTFYGEQGSAKTTTMKILRSIIDPSRKEPSSMPRDVDDLMIMTRNNYIIDLDNISRISDSQSDDICRLVTGTAFTKRKLYSDSEEIVVSAMRPVIANGIAEFTTRSDLASRSIIIELPIIVNNQRVTMRDLESRFEAASSKILGALLSAVSKALSRRGLDKILSDERMPDAWEFATAAEPVLGLAPGTFLAAYRRNQERANQVVIQSSSIGNLTIELAKQTWSGSAQLLLDHLSLLQYKEGAKLPKDWPIGPKMLSDQLRRLSPAFRKTGVQVRFYQTDGSNSQRMIEISMIR